MKLSVSRLSSRVACLALAATLTAWASAAAQATLAAPSADEVAEIEAAISSFLMDSSYKLPGGGLVSTAEDLARFAIAVQNGVLIGPKTLREMSRNHVTADGKETGYGYGWYVGTREGRQPDGSIWHGGVQPGFTSDLWLLPGKRFALVILTNLEGGGRLGLAALANQIAAVVLR